MNCDVDEDGFLVPMSDEAIARWEATPLVGLHAAATLPLDTLPHRVEEQTRSLSEQRRRSASVRLLRHLPARRE